MDYEIGKLNLGQAEEVSVLLREKGIEKTVDEILTSKCLVAIDESGNIISFAEHIGQDKADVHHFRALSKKEKTRIKVGFFSVIFRKQVWESKGPIEVGTETEITENHGGYMFPGG
jgi:hypothetical protein